MEIAGKIIDEKWLKEQFERFSEQCIDDGVVPSSAIELAKNSKIWRRFEKEVQQGEQKMNEGWEV